MTIRAMLPSAVAIGAMGSAVAAMECGTITLGAVVSLTGKYATRGVHVQNGYEFAIDKIAETGGVKVGDACYTFEVLYYDDESKAERAATLAERLIQQDGVQYMLGPYSSGLTKAIATVTETYQIPMVQAAGASRALFNQGDTYLFTVLSTSEQYLASAITLAAKTAEAEGKDASDVTLAIAVGTDPFSLDIRAGVMELAQRYGMKIVVDETLPRDLSDMTAILTKVTRARPDVLLVTGHAKGAATAVRQIGAQQIRVPLVAITHCEAADLVGAFGDFAEGILCATQWAETLTYEDPIFGTAATYAQEVRAAYPEFAETPLPAQTAQASAAVYVFKHAFERAGALDKEAVRDAIAATVLSTFYGDITFSDAGNNIAKPMVLRQIQDGRYNVVAPSAVASHELTWPRN